MGDIEQHEIPFEGKRFRNLKRRRGIFLLPAMMTSANLLCGYYAVVASLVGSPEDLDHAAKAIGLAILFDSLDGRLARLTGTNTEFGVQFDSLADVVSFGIAPAVMAAEMERRGGWLVHYSTDYVFDGSGSAPWRETDATGPLNVYGQSKLEGERAIAGTGCRHVVLRTSWVYAAEGKNFLHTMLRLGRDRKSLSVVNDQVGAPTSAEGLARATVAVLEKVSYGGAESGVYHLSCGGETSWYGFAKAIFAEFASQQAVPEVTGIPSEAYPTPAKRPRNSRLCCDKFAVEFGIRLPAWDVELKAVAATLLKRA